MQIWSDAPGGRRSDMSIRNNSSNPLSELEATRAALSALAARNSDIVCRIDFSGDTLYIPKVFANRYGLPEVIDCLPENLFKSEKIHDSSRDTVSELYYEMKHGRKTGSCIFKYNPENYISVWLKATLTGFSDGENESAGAVVIISEVTGRSSESESCNDVFPSADFSECNLLSRDQFRNTVNQYIRANSDEGKYSALYILDLNGFMDILRMYGNTAGQKILDSVSESLLTFSRPSVAGKMYGDEFMLFVKDIASYDDLNITARQICSICTGISANEAGTEKVSGCTGVAVSPLHGDDFDTLYKKAELALHSAKRFDKTMYAIYSEEKASDRRQLSFTDFKEKCSETVKQSGTWFLFNADIKHFRNINLIHGYENGEIILQEICSLLQEFLNPGEFFTRLFGDNFLLLTNADDDKIVSIRMDDIISRLQKFCLNGTGEIQFAAGYVAVDDSNRDTEFESIIDCAVIAHERAKKEKGTSFIKFEPGMGDEEFRKYEILSELPAALRNGQICTFVQPQYDIVRHEYVSMEALVRWNHPVRGVIQPDSFIGVCEENGFISSIDFCVLEQMCSLIRNRLDLNLRVLPVAVNQSQVTIHEEGYVERIIALVEKYRISPEYFELEVTESACVNKLHETVEILNRLRDYGFRISMDDFGAGYSTLNYLKDIPVDTLKIDKEFLKENFAEQKPAEIIRAITSMAHNINIKVICEGVELEQQVQFLENIGCEVAQGFLFGRPMPFDEADTLINESVNF